MHTGVQRTLTHTQTGTTTHTCTCVHVTVQVQLLQVVAAIAVKAKRMVVSAEEFVSGRVVEIERSRTEASETATTRIRLHLCV